MSHVMGGWLSLAAVALLTLSSWALGRAVSVRLAWPELAAYERVALRLTAGLGLTSLVLSIAALAGAFARAPAIVGALAVAGAILAARDLLRFRRPATMTGMRLTPGVRLTALAVIATAIVASAGTIAPVTDDDALAYVIPIARHIAETGEARVWTDQARSMWPQSQQVLLAFVIQTGGDRLGLVTALEWLLCLGVVSALARRVCERREHVWPAVVIALGAPVLAFQVPSAKEDLVVLAASTAAGFCLAGAGGAAELAAAGLFAGTAAGAKYSGAFIAIAVVGWVLVHEREGRFRKAATVAASAALAGGLWYAVNFWRYGNPVAPFVFGARGTLWDAGTIASVLDSYRPSHGVMGFLFAPLDIFIAPDGYTGRANLYNPLAYAGLLALVTAAGRRRHGALLFVAGVFYVSWFVTLQNARVLLPAIVLLAPAAADRLVPFVRGRKPLYVVAAGAVLVSLGVVAAVGAVRAERYIRDPSAFLARETQRYADIAWMNAHLDPARHRVGSSYKVLAYLDVPSLVLWSSFQIEISDDEMNDPARFLEACRRQGLTHLFGPADGFANIRGHLRSVYRNPASRLGGVRFFREPPTEATEIFEIVYADVTPGDRISPVNDR